MLAAKNPASHWWSKRALTSIPSLFNEAHAEAVDGLSFKQYASVMEEEHTMTTLTLSQVVYQFNAVEEQARDLLDSTKHVFDNLSFARALRAQKSQHLSDTERSWIDGILGNTDKTLDNVRALIEPARVDMQTNFGNVGFVNRSLFVFRDSPKVQTNLARLTIASGSLDNVLGILLSRPGPTSTPMTPQTLSPHNSTNSEPLVWQPRIGRIASEGALSTISRFSDPPGYPSPAPSQPPESPNRLSIPLTQERSPQTYRHTSHQPRPYSRCASENVLELADTSSQVSAQRGQSSNRSFDGTSLRENGQTPLIRRQSQGRPLSDDGKISVVQEATQTGLGLQHIGLASQQYQQLGQNRQHDPETLQSAEYPQQVARSRRQSDQYAPEPVDPEAGQFAQRRQLPSQQRLYEDKLARHRQLPVEQQSGRTLLNQSQYRLEPNQRFSAMSSEQAGMQQRSSVSSMATTMSPGSKYIDDKNVLEDTVSQMSSSRASGSSRRKAFLAYQATR